MEHASSQGGSSAHHWQVSSTREVSRGLPGVVSPAPGALSCCPQGGDSRSSPRAGARWHRGEEPGRGPSESFPRPRFPRLRGRGGKASGRVRLRQRMPIQPCARCHQAARACCKGRSPPAKGVGGVWSSPRRLTGPGQCPGGSARGPLPAGCVGRERGAGRAGARPEGDRPHALSLQCTTSSRPPPAGTPTTVPSSSRSASPSSGWTWRPSGRRCGVTGTRPSSESRVSPGGRDMAGGRGSGPQSWIPLEATVRGSAPQPGVTGRGHGSGGGH